MNSVSNTTKRARTEGVVGGAGEMGDGFLARLLVGTGCVALDPGRITHDITIDFQRPCDRTHPLFLEARGKVQALSLAQRDTAEYAISKLHQARYATQVNE
jgi:hypothetical protein